ncbi:MULTISPECIES: glycosyltransferase family 39 protein [Chromobacterium]|uniref:glycosyltransferase family 39 protein n=1 Tax=Chromobacterium TaxID=535 RepID=UPI001888876E|nr:MULTISPECIES: glycosyltransferase family 39 protein [Chromobacterium]QOZ82588.1 glycosyltransferase family 39 protein [Chromobacterium sp. Rain0013]WON82640.1 glycosyltransferase family 39 protein [Chromobacterium haemolyticum]
MNQPHFSAGLSSRAARPWQEPALWLLFAVVWFGSLGYRGLIHADEGRYATLSLFMLHSGDWITPRLNGLLYFEKPALQYWMGALSFAAFGVNEFAARFWPGLTGFLSVAMCGFTARRLWGVDAGRYAALTAGSCAWIVANSHFLSLDMGVSFFLTVALCGFLLAQHDSADARATRHWMWVTWAAMAAATLSKGLIGLLIPGATLVLYSLLNWQWGFWKRMHWLSGLALFLLLTAPWFILVSQRNPDFAHFFFIREHLERFLTTEHKRTGAPWYFVPYLLLGLLPWTSLLPALCRDGWREPGARLRVGRLLLIWSVFIFAFFSKSSSKLPSYILPMFPALALLLAPTLQRMPSAALKKHLLPTLLLWLAALALYPFVDRFASEDIPLDVLHGFAHFVAAAALLFLVCAAVARRLLGRERKLAALCWLAFGSLLAVSVAAAGHDSYGRLKGSKEIVRQIQPYLNADTPVFSVRYYDQTFPFYLGRPVTLVQFVDEFEFGESQEPQRWMPRLEQFVAAWNAAPRALAMTDPATYQELQAQGLPMRVVYQDPRRLVVAKP